MKDVPQKEKCWITPDRRYGGNFGKIPFVHQDDSYIYAIDKFRVPGSQCDEPNTKLDSWVAFCKKENVNWGIDWGNITGSFGEIQVWKSTKTFSSTFWLNAFKKVPTENQHRRHSCGRTVWEVGNCRLRHWLKGYNCYFWRKLSLINKVDHTSTDRGIANFRQWSFFRKCQIAKN